MFYPFVFFNLYIHITSIINQCQAKNEQNTKKTTFLLLFFDLFAFCLTNCSIQLEKCKFEPDYGRIGESIKNGVQKNQNIEVRAGQIVCPF